ncbi:MAG TPA: Asp23/Gls24 family envelope stress response protein [Mycobacteriales bacterium]|nr:Asp23/Gls24 family envelope stress response protein [Mycobacteriales bacterium]
MTTDLPDADRIAAAVLRQPAVAALHGGVFGEVATYLPGRRVTGVQVGGDRIAVHVTTILGEPMNQVAARIREIVVPLADGHPVDVVIEDCVSAADAATAHTVDTAGADSESG